MFPTQNPTSYFARSANEIALEVRHRERQLARAQAEEKARQTRKQRSRRSRWTTSLAALFFGAK